MMISTRKVVSSLQRNTHVLGLSPSNLAGNVPNVLIIQRVPIRLFSNKQEEIKTFALEYTYVSNMAEKRGPHRPAHLEFTKPFVENKKLIAGGAYVPEIEKGLLVFKCTKSEVEEFAKKDPYVVNGLVHSYIIREWAVAVGGL